MFWGDSAAYGWWVTGTEIRGGRLGRVDSLGAALDFLRRAIERDRAVPWRPVASRIYRQMVAPLEPSGTGPIFAVVDGPLTRVPLEVLVPAIDSAPLGAVRDIVYGPSASVLAALAGTARPPGWERTMLAVGNPRASSRDQTDDGTEPLRGEDRHLNLPFAEYEAKEIGALYRDQGSDVLVGREVTLAGWMAQKPGRYRYLHFAAHATVSDREPDQSRLLFADGVLDARAIRDLELSAELVTLSACETAAGRRVRGEGVVGLSHAFLSAGARSALVTLWPVTDRSTALFMTALYRELHDGRAPAQALRLVRQRWIEGKGPTSHPAAWAPFVLIGDPIPPRP